MEEGWNIAYTDGTGAAGQAASAVYSEDHRSGPAETYGAFLGSLATVADTEGKAVALGIAKEPADMLYIIMDSQTALQTAINISKGATPRSRIELELREALHKRRDQDTAITWICSHIGIRGNVEGDGRAAFKSTLGVVAGSPRVAIWEGLRVASKATCREFISDEGLGLRRTDWGPQKSWLKHIGKAQDAARQCGHPREEGSHNTVTCPRFRKERREMIGPASTWAELDELMWAKEENDDSYDKVEAFFGLLFTRLM